MEQTRIVATERTPIGLLFSAEGSYSVVCRSMLNGAILAIEELNARDGLQIDAIVANPGGELGQYTSLCEKMLVQGIRHIVGCYTSSSRKEVIPLFEKFDALLWYPSHYEGFECSSNVIYTGAVPNQHLLPLVDYIVKHFGRTAFCVGSNYIWAWENNRILRENVQRLGGQVVAERYFALGNTDFTQVIDTILEVRPAFVFNTLIGISAYQFLRAFRSACEARGIDQATEIPVASCSLSEPELEIIGAEAVDGHLSSSVYFSTIASPENALFVDAYARRFPDGPSVCADAEATYVAVHLLALALSTAENNGVPAVRRAVARQQIAAPQGKVWIDPETLHAALTPRIGRSNKNARFDIVMEAAHPVPPDPYLIRNSPRFGTIDARAALRVAS